MDKLRELIPFLVPVIMLQFILIIAALADLARRERTRGPKWAWVLVIIFVNLLGPIIYFVVGREE